VDAATHRKLKELPELARGERSAERRLQAMLDIDADTASRLGIVPQLIDDTLYDAFGQRQVSTIYTQLNQYHVVARVLPAYQENPTRSRALREVGLRRAGAPVLLHPLSCRARHPSPSITRTVSVSDAVLQPSPRVALGHAVTAIKNAERQIELPVSIRPSFQGTAQAFQASLATQPLLILAALITVYIVLGVLYESYIHPVTILSTRLRPGGRHSRPAALPHASRYHRAHRIILLIGIVKKNAIMMIDFALEAEREAASLPRRRSTRPVSCAPANHDDDHGRPPRGLPSLSHGHRLGAAAAARHHHRGRLILSQSSRSTPRPSSTCISIGSPGGSVASPTRARCPPGGAD